MHGLAGKFHPVGGFCGKSALTSIARTAYNRTPSSFPTARSRWQNALYSAILGDSSSSQSLTTNVLRELEAT